MMDYKQLLIKYIQLVNDREGTSCLLQAEFWLENKLNFEEYKDFTDEELKDLVKIAKEENLL